MTFSDSPDAHDKASVSRADSGLIRIDDHARVADGSTLNGVFTGEGCPEQQTSARRQFAFWVETIGELVGVPMERVRQAMMPPVEPDHHVVKALLNVVIRQRQNAL